MKDFSLNLRVLLISTFFGISTLAADSSVLPVNVVKNCKQEVVSLVELAKENEQLMDQIDNLLQQIDLYDQKQSVQKGRSHLASLALKTGTVSGSVVGAASFMIISAQGALAINKRIIHELDMYKRGSRRDRKEIDARYSQWTTGIILASGLASSIGLFVAFEKLVDYLSTRGQKNEAKEVAAKLELLKKAFDELKADMHEQNAAVHELSA